MTTKQCDEQTAALREKIHAWEHEKQSKQRHMDALAKKRDSLRSASLRNKDPKATAALQDARAAMSVAMLELDDLSAEIAKASTEIEELLNARIEAARQECWDKFRVEAKAAEKQAQELERHVADFSKLVTPHAQKLQELAQLARDGGHERADFTTKHLWRRLNAQLHSIIPFDVGRQDKAYAEPYPKILRHVFDNAERQHAPQQSEAVNE